MEKGSIICIVKGGKKGINAAKKAINIAKENHMKLIFIFSADTENMIGGNFGVESDESTSEGLENIGNVVIDEFENMAKKEKVAYSSKIINEDLKNKLKRIIKYNKVSHLVVPKLERGAIEKLIVRDNTSELVDEIRDELPDLNIYFA